MLLYSTCFFVCVQLAQAQSSMGMENDLKRITSGNGSSIAINTFTNSAIKGSRYFFDDWTSGSVTSVSGENYALNYVFNFDKVNQDVYAKDNKNGIVVLLDKTKIKTFKMGAVAFVNSATLKNAARDVFYQILVEDTTKVSLYKFTATRFVKADATNIMNARTGNFTSEYVDDVSYYVSMKNGELKKSGLSEKNIRKALKEKADKVDTYLTMNSTKDVDESFLTDLVRYVNE